MTPTTSHPMLTSDTVLQRFREAGALLEGHFRLSSGLHSPGYLQCALVLQYPRDAERLGQAIAAATAHLEPTVVLSPALGGVIIGQEVARSLGVRAIFAERQDKVMTLRRGFTLASSDRVLVVEDVVTTGGSTRETMAVAETARAQVVGAAAIIDRASGTHLGVPFVALARISLPTYDPDRCPLCEGGLPITKPGSKPG